MAARFALLAAAALLIPVDLLAAQDGPGEWRGPAPTILPSPPYGAPLPYDAVPPSFPAPGYGAGQWVPPSGAEPLPSSPYPGWVVPPVVWVRVPILRAGQPCDCERIEEGEIAPAPALRMPGGGIPRRAISGKRVRLRR